MLGDHLVAGKAGIMQSGQVAVVAGLAPDVDLHELTRRRAEEIYIRNGRIPGRDIENWTQAEQEIRAEFERASRRTAIVVRVSGVQYVANTHAMRLMATFLESSSPEHRFRYVWTATGCL